MATATFKIKGGYFMRKFLLFCFSLLPVFGIASDDAQFTYTCDGMPGVKLGMTSQNIDNTGQGRASTQPVQFNVNMAAATNSTIFVNERNSPTCTVRVNDKFTITGSTFSYLKGGSWTSGEGVLGRDPAPHVVDGSLRISSQILNNQTISFTMSRAGNAVGNSTVAFNVLYRPDKK